MLDGYHPDHSDRILRFRRVYSWRTRLRPIHVRLNPRRRGPAPGSAWFDPQWSNLLGQSAHPGWPQFLQASLGDALVDVSVCMLPMWPGARRLMKSLRAGRGPANESLWTLRFRPSLTLCQLLLTPRASTEPTEMPLLDWGKRIAPPLGSTGSRWITTPLLRSLRSRVPPPPPALPVDPWLTAPHTPPQRVADTRRQPMRLSALFEEFCQFLRVEKGATPATIATYRWCFGDFLAFVMKQVGGTVLLAHFTEETCRSYQYDLAGRELKSGTIRVRVATLGELRQVDGPPRQAGPQSCGSAHAAASQGTGPGRAYLGVGQEAATAVYLRERAILALMAHGGLRRGEVAALDVGDVAPDFGLRRVMGKGGHEVPGGLAGAGARHPARLHGHRASRAASHGAAFRGHVQEQSGSADRAADHGAEDLEGRQGRREPGRG